MKESIDKGEGPRIRWLGERAIWTQAATKDLCVASEDQDSLLFGDRRHQKAGRSASNPGLALRSCLSYINHPEPQFLQQSAENDNNSSLSQ